jgi:hypothetical protein
VKLNVFVENYFSAHPDESYDTNSYNAYSLFDLFTKIRDECKVMSYSYASYWESWSSDWKDNKLNEVKIFWLFYDMPFGNLIEDLQKLMIEKFDPSLNEQDYAVIFYASLQAAELGTATKDLPSSMLYDLFLPVAEENLSKWKLKTK